MSDNEKLKAFLKEDFERYIKIINVLGVLFDRLPLTLQFVFGAWFTLWFFKNFFLVLDRCLK